MTIVAVPGDLREHPLPECLDEAALTAIHVEDIHRVDAQLDIIVQPRR